MTSVTLRKWESGELRNWTEKPEIQVYAAHVALVAERTVHVAISTPCPI